MSTHEPCRYEIRVQGRIDARWMTLLDEMKLEHEPGGITDLRGPVADQAALHGLLARLRDIGVPLISVAVDASRNQDDR
jgi:hypothetical protein